MIPIFFKWVYPKDHKNAQMKIIDVCPAEKMPFF